MTLTRANEGWLRLPIAALILLVGGCTLALERESRQCAKSADCARIAPNSVCTSDGLCELLSVSSASAVCTNDRDCAGAWSICYQGSCQELDQAPCVGIEGPESFDGRQRLPFVMLLSDTELQGDDARAPTIGVALSVLEGFATARQESPAVPELVGVACPATDAGALQRLAESGVRLVIGSVQGDTLRAASEALQQRAVLFAAVANEPSLLEPADVASDVVSCKPNSLDTRAAQLAAALFVRDQLNHAGLLGKDSAVTLARSHDEALLGYGLEAPELDQVEYDASPDGQGLVQALGHQEHVAGLLVAASGHEDWSHNLKAVEAARQVARQAPAYYLLQDLQAGTLDTVAIGAAGLPERTAWLDAASHSAVSANQRPFAEDYAAATGKGTPPSLGYLYDCLYVALYATIAAELRFGNSAREVTARTVLLGLASLIDGEERVNVGSESVGRAVELLRAGQGLAASLDLAGSSGDLQFVAELDALNLLPGDAGKFVRPAADDLELYCVDRTRGQHCASGVRFRATGEPAEGASECDCFSFP